jgi:ComF family protein
MLHHQETPEEQTIRDEFGKLGKIIEYAHCRAAYTFVAGSPIQSVIHSFKYDGMVKLAAQFGKSISFLTPREVNVIIPVPLHRTRLAERGYNQADAIAKAIASQTKANVVPASKRARPTPSQTNLPLPKRIENMRGAFVLTRDAEKIKGKNILIVDDVMTTGSTLASVAEALLHAKPKSISTLALAIAEQTAQ